VVGPLSGIWPIAIASGGKAAPEIRQEASDLMCRVTGCFERGLRKFERSVELAGFPGAVIAVAQRHGSPADRHVKGRQAP
jgi:hypothetical protein